MRLCRLVDKLSTYKRGFRRLNPGVIREKNSRLKKDYILRSINIYNNLYP